MTPYHHFFAEQISITPVFVKAELILMCCFFAIVTIHHAFNFVFSFIMIVYIFIFSPLCMIFDGIYSETFFK